jgi:hypothetical protein
MVPVHARFNEIDVLRGQWDGVHSILFPGKELLTDLHGSQVPYPSHDLENASDGIGRQIRDHRFPGNFLHLLNPLLHERFLVLQARGTLD